MLHIIEEHRKKIVTVSEKEQVFENIQYDTNKYCVGERTHVFLRKGLENGIGNHLQILVNDGTLYSGEDVKLAQPASLARHYLNIGLPYLGIGIVHKRTV
jgi:hypothetical protein